MRDKLVSTLSEFDDLRAELEDISNLLTLFDENISSELEPIRSGKDWGGKYFFDRWPLYESMLNVIHFRLYAILQEMQVAISKGFEFRKESGTKPIE